MSRLDGGMPHDSEATQDELRLLLSALKRALVKRISVALDEPTCYGHRSVRPGEPERDKKLGGECAEAVRLCPGLCPHVSGRVRSSAVARSENCAVCLAVRGGGVGS